MATMADYDAWALKQKQDAVGGAKVVLGQQFDAAPDAVAADLTTAVDFGATTGNPVPPLALVQQNRSEFQQAIDAAKAGTILGDSPTLAGWLSEPNNAAVARDDIKSLSWWERAGKAAAAGNATAITQGQDFTRDAKASIEGSPVGRAIEGASDAFDAAILTNSDGTPNLLGHIANFLRGQETARDGLPRDLIGGAQFTADERATAIATNAPGPIYAAAKSLLTQLDAEGFKTASLTDIKSPADLIPFLMENVAASAPQMATAMASGALAPLLQLATLGGQANDELKTRTDLPPDQRIALAAGAGTVMAALDLFGMSKVFGGASPGKVAGEALDGFLVETLVKRGVPAAIATSIEAAIVEGSTEALQDGIVIAIAQMSGGQYSANEVAARLANSFVTGGAVGGAIHGSTQLPGAVLRVGEKLAARQQKASAATGSAAILKKLTDEATGSVLRERMPAKFQEFVERATAGGPVADVFIPADKFVEYFQSQGIDPAVMAASLKGVGVNDLETALETGSDLKIPTASYAASIAGSNHDAWLMENMKFRPDDFTSAEAKAFNDNADAAMQEAYDLADQLRRDDEELRSVETEIYDTMVSRLRVAGRATDVATSEAMLYPAFYRTMAERSGMSIDDFMAKYPLPQVQGAAPAGMQLKDVSELQRTLATARARRTAGLSGGKSLLEFIDSKGGVADPGGDIAAMDASVVKRGKGKKTLRIVRKPSLMAGVAGLFGAGEKQSNGSIDLMAHAAYEAGYMAHDPRVMGYHAAIQSGSESVDIVPAFLDAIRGELAGSPDFANADTTVAPDGIDTIEEYLAGLGVSLDNTDEEIRAAMERGQGGADSAMFGQSAPADRNMFVAHNIKPDGLLNAIKMGGLPMPSLAVARVDRGGFDGFGSITLLGSPDLIDPKGGSGAKTYNADAYSPRYPKVSYEVDDKKFNALNKPMTEAVKAYGGSEHDSVDLSRFEDTGPARMPLSAGMKLAWLTEHGIQPAPRLKDDGSPDRYASFDAINDVAKEHLAEIEAWAAEKLAGLVKRERIFKGFTNSGNRRYVDHTIENALADMRSRLKEGEGWNYGVGNVRARFAKVFKSITGMQADREKLVDADAIAKVKQSFDDRFDALMESLRPYYKFDRNGFGYMDDASAMIGEISTKGIRALNEGFDNIPADLMNEVRQFTADLASAPTGYFETKINRIVSLREFSAAVVPSTLPARYVDAIKGLGLEVHTYDPAVDGSRNEAIKAVDMQTGGEVLFQPAYHGTPHLFEKFSTAHMGTGEGVHVSVTSFEQPADGSGFGSGAGLGASPRGMISFPAAGVGNGETVISTFAGADLSTVLHESGHYFLTVLRDMATKDPAGAMGADFDAIKDWWHSNAEAVAADAVKAVPGVVVTADDVRLALDGGTSGDALKDQAINVGMQEQFARATEAYLMEGKAPSIELRSAFEKFRAWLLSIYKKALGLNVSVSDEMRAVFDRMLATDQQIADAKQDAADTAPLFATAEEMGLSPEAYAKFRKLYGQANDEAAAKVLAAVMEPIRRAATAAYKVERAAVVLDVTGALQNDTTFRSIQELRFGKGFDGAEVPAVKLSREAIETDYGVGHLQFLPGATKDGNGHRNAVFSDEGGMHPDVVAAMYGFPSGAAFLDAIEKAPPLSDAISAEVEKEMASRHSDPLTDGSVQRIALEATHGDKRGAVLAAELHALNEVAGFDRGLTAKDARETARRTLQTMPVRDAVRSDRFLTAERNAGEASFKLASTVTREGLWMDAARRKVSNAVSAALRANDGALALGVNAATDKANANTLRNNKRVGELIEAKRRQLLNHMLYDESRKVADGVEKLVAKVAKLNKADAKLGKVRDIDYVKAARAIAAKFGLANGDKAFEFAMWVEQLRIDDPITLDALSQAIATYGQDAKPYKLMTVAELGALGDAIDSLLEVGKRARLLEVDGIAVDRELAISEMQDVLDTRTKTENAALKAKLTKAQKFKIKALTIVSSLRRMENWSREMDDGKSGVFTKYLVKPVMDALGTYRVDKAARLSALLAIIEPRKKDLLGAAIPAPELGYTFENKGEFLHALLHTGNESNLEKLLMGRGWSVGLTGQQQKSTKGGKLSVDRKGNPLMTRGRVDTTKWDALVARLIAENKLTKADYDTAQAIWNLMDEIKRPAQSAHRKVFGFYFKEVEATPLDTPFGIFRGGYVPAVADIDASNDGQIRQDQQALEAQQTSFMFPTTGSGFTKSRVQNYTTPLSLNLMLLPAHMDKVLRFTHLNPVIRQTASLIAAGPLRASLDAMDKSIATDLIVPWLQRTAQQAVEAQPTTPSGRAASSIFRALRKRVGVHTMFGNLVNTAQQITGLSSAMVLVKPSRMRASLVRFAKGGGDVMRQEASAASPFMRDRIENAGREITGRIQDAIVKPTVWSGVDGFFTKHGYVLQQAAQNLADVIAWHAGYDGAIASGMSPNEAVFEADSVIRRTMGDFSPENVSMFETGDAFKRLFTMFYSYFNGQANLVGGEMQTAMRTMGWGGSGRMFFIYLFGIAIPAIVGEAIVQAANGSLGDDDEDDGYADELAQMFFGSQLRYGAGMVPIAGQLTTTMLNRFNNQFYDDRLSTSPVVATTEKAIGAPAAVLDAVTGNGSARVAVVDGLALLSLVTGVPLGQLSKMAGYAVGTAEGYSHPTNALDVARGMISGRDGTEN